MNSNDDSIGQVVLSAFMNDNTLVLFKLLGLK